MNKRIRGRRVLLVLASRPSRPRPSAVGLTVAGAAAAAAAAYLLHRIGQRSGATDEETDAVLPGDELVTHPMWESTRAVTIDAPVEEVWPWIVQMGPQQAPVDPWEQPAGGGLGDHLSQRRCPFQAVSSGVAHGTFDGLVQRDGGE